MDLGGASPLRAVMAGIVRLGKGVRREAESEGSRCQNADLTNRNRIEGYHGGVTRPWTGEPDSHPDTRGSRSGRDRRRETQLTLGGLGTCLVIRLLRRRRHGNGDEESAEVIVACELQVKGRIF